MRNQLLAFTLIHMAAATLPAQQVGGGPDPERQATTVHVSSDKTGTLAAVSIDYTAAAWRNDYDAVLKSIEGSNYTRLGTGWWTRLDTIGPLEIGGTKIEPGSYYLGLAVAKDGAFSLLLFDSKTAMQARLLPGTTALYTGEAKPVARAPMTLAKDSLPQPASKMQIELTADPKNPTTGKLSIRWGKHELSAPIQLQLATAKEPPPARK